MGDNVLSAASRPGWPQDIGTRKASTQVLAFLRPEEQITSSRHGVKRQIPNTLAVDATTAMRTDQADRCLETKSIYIRQERNLNPSPFPGGMDAIITGFFR